MPGRVSDPGGDQGPRRPTAGLLPRPARLTRLTVVRLGPGSAPRLRGASVRDDKNIDFGGWLADEIATYPPPSIQFIVIPAQAGTQI